MIETASKRSTLIRAAADLSFNGSVSSTITADNLPKVPFAFEDEQDPTFDSDSTDRQDEPLPSSPRSRRSVSFDLAKNSIHYRKKFSRNLTWYSSEEQYRFKLYTQSMAAKANKLSKENRDKKANELPPSYPKPSGNKRPSLIKNAIQKSLILGKKKVDKRSNNESTACFGVVLGELRGECERCELGESLRTSPKNRKRFESLYQKQISGAGIEIIGLESWLDGIKEEIQDKRDSLQLTVEEVQADCDNQFIPGSVNRHEELMLQSACLTHSSQLFAYWIAKAQYNAK